MTCRLYVTAASGMMPLLRAVIVNRLVPGAVGTPVMPPVSLFRLSPAGSAPDVTSYRTVLGELEVTLNAYSSPTRPSAYPVS